MNVYVYINVYLLNRDTYAEAGYRFHSYTGTAVGVNTFYFGDGCSRPENAKGVLLHFENVCATSNCQYISGDKFPLRAGDSLSCPGRKKKVKIYTYIHIHTYTVIWCMYMHVFV